MRIFLKRYLGFSAKEEAFFLNAEPLVIMGRGHSGTRVFSEFCERLGYNLDAANKMSTGDASDLAFTNEIKRISLAYLKKGTSPELVKRFKSAVLHYFRGLGHDKNDWGWKFPETYLIGPIVMQAFPKAKLLHVVRDGRDIAFKTHQTDRQDRPLGSWILKKMSVLNAPHYLQAAASWQFQVDAFDTWKSNVGAEQIHEVTFESFISEPIKQGQAISDFLSKEFHSDHKRQLSQAIDPNKIAQHSQEPSDQLKQVEKLIFNTLQRWNYL